MWEGNGRVNRESDFTGIKNGKATALKASNQGCTDSSTLVIESGQPSVDNEVEFVPSLMPRPS